MLRNILLPTILIILGWGFWISPDFKVIAAGVAIFLFGMLSMETGFKVYTGGTLEKILARATDKRWKSLSFGIVTTSVMQSSSLVSVITISFLSAGLIGLTQGVGIIFGANLGTTTGAWLIAGFGLKVNISAYAMPMLVFGTLLIFQNSKNLKGLGYILAGLGFLFLGIHYMKEGFEAFKDTLDVSQFVVTGFKGLIIYTLIGIGATVVMQSSHATLVLTITALSSGQIGYENALALAIGANVGTTITAIIGSLGSNEQGKRLAAAHLIFNLVTGVVAIVFITQILQLVDFISANVGIADNDFSLKLAVFHSIFNLLGVLIMLPLINSMVDVLQKIIPTKTPSKIKPRFLHESSLGYADTATEAVRNETLHMWDNTIDLIAHGIRIPREEVLNKSSKLDALVLNFPVKQAFDVDRYYELKIKSLYGDIISFISQASFGWELEQSGEIYWLRTANQDMVDAIKDIKHLQKNLAKYTVSNNDVIKSQYNGFRIQIASLVQSLESIRHASSDDIPSLMLDQLKVESDTQYTQQNKSINEMIRNRLISAEMAISLMNDASYVYN
ncbi:MAG: Na/Pi cotransporter family protein, partial [Gammaproteobacteria bacterium]